MCMAVVMVVAYNMSEKASPRWTAAAVMMRSQGSRMHGTYGFMCMRAATIECIFHVYLEYLAKSLKAMADRSNATDDVSCARRRAR